MEKKHKKYKPAKFPENIVEEPAVAYNTAFDRLHSPLTLMGLAHEGMQSSTDFITHIRAGIPKKALDHLAHIIGFSDSELAGILHTSDRTLRRYTPAQKLNAEQSERVIELARLYTRGAEVFDNLEQFKTWMATPVDALGAKPPKEFLDTSIGIGLLMDELGRIEHGIFA
ncbi:hypothetical protein A8C56_17365 [Niabella ginsenosidivorans]|uniref:Uncharacterized protein n=1 Tax=Niabella ginsenosidivorans TaxID=1176587 RepID=A0A1A9I7J5_9BACT|nr:antitoxin Xre-like helix-turn-helix domain-containing protein [Niabella ginsenosidivorans]ANH82504.1 hypothetical protein A8C56_17365 [Niabella ginsenosidivorans]